MLQIIFSIPVHRKYSRRFQQKLGPQYYKKNEVNPSQTVEKRIYGLNGINKETMASLSAQETVLQPMVLFFELVLAILFQGQFQ